MYGIIEQISSNSTTFSSTEQKVADIILKNPEKVVEMSIGKIAAQAEVSDPTIIRFCRLLGFDGFKEFKIKLAQEIASSNHYVHQDVKVGDDAATYIRRVGQYTINTLTTSLNSIHADLVEKAVHYLSNASKIEFWGFGASAAVARDAYHKFFRLGIPCIATEDTHMQAMSAGVLDKNSVIVVISHTGRSKELIENVKIARSSGAVVIGITTSHSPLEEVCTMVLNVDVNEDTSVYTPMASRHVHLLLIDILVVGVTLQRGSIVTDHLKQIKNALTEKKLKGGE